MKGIVLPHLKVMGSVGDVSWNLCRWLEGSRKSLSAPTRAVLWSESLSIAESFSVCHSVLKGRESGADAQQILQKAHACCCAGCAWRRPKQ